MLNIALIKLKCFSMGIKKGRARQSAYKSAQCEKALKSCFAMVSSEIGNSFKIISIAGSLESSAKRLSTSLRRHNMCS